MNNRMYTVYEHVSKDGKRYIGITSQKVAIRWRRGNGYVKNIHFYRSIQKYGWENFEHNILAENVDEEQAKIIEKELIKKYKTTDPEHGYNVTLGGDTRQPCPEYVKELIRQKNKGKPKSDETRKRMSEAAKKRGPRPPMSKEQKEKISKSLIGNKRALGKHNNTKSVVMCDMDNTVLKVFKSAVDAGNEMDCSPSGIGVACKENMKSEGLDKTKYGGIYCGYKWFFLDKQNRIINNNHGYKENGRNTPIIQYNLQGEKIKEFDNIKHATTEMGFSRNSLCFALKKRDKAVYKGFLWVRKKYV